MLASPIPIGRSLIDDPTRPIGRASPSPRSADPLVNIGAARIADQMGADADTGPFRRSASRQCRSSCAAQPHPVPRELEAAPVLTNGFGHSIAVTPLHLANAYATLVNGGIWRPRPCFGSSRARRRAGRRVYSEATSRRMRRCCGCRDPGPAATPMRPLRVGGKTGTAKILRSGATRNVNVSTFAGFSNG